MKTTILYTAAIIGACALLSSALKASEQQDEAPKTALSLLGEVKYNEEFKHFDYVNPEAPKGGSVRLSTPSSFDSLNPFIARGSSAPGLSLIYDSLMKSSSDEVATNYPLIATSVSVPNDISSATFTLNPNATWHDGTPITPQDVIFSLDVMKKGGLMTAYYANVTEAKQTGDHEVTFTFNETGNKELPFILGQLTILPKHYWTAKDEKGNPRDPLAPYLETPLGSGSYKIKHFEAGRTIVYEREKAYWGKDLPVNIGYNNFDEISYLVYRDDTVALEAFKSGEIDFRLENRAKNWATAYDFPAVKNGDVVLETFPRKASGVMQGFVMNLRRDKFKDARVREALNYAFNFEDINRVIFSNQYTRAYSYFSGTELAAENTKAPEGREAEILEELNQKFDEHVPDEVLTSPYKNPTYTTNEDTRTHIRKAKQLLKDAGFTIKNTKLHTPDGNPFEIEFLLSSPVFEPIVLRYIQTLEKRLGITATVRTADASTYINRLNDRDFDVITHVWGQSLNPGNEQRNYWGSQSADLAGAQNFAGIRNPAIDAVIERIIFAKSREEQVAATRALDRMLLWNHFVVPQWYLPFDRTARWDKYAHPDPLPDYSFGFPDIWWAK